MQEKQLRQYIKGCEDTWNLIFSAAEDIPGIGDKTQAKLLAAIRVRAAQEVEKVNALRAAERNKLRAAIDGIGGK